MSTRLKPDAILAIESSCDETAASVVKGGRTILSNVLNSQIRSHEATGGVVPEVAARLQLETILPVVTAALREAKTDWDGIDAIAVAEGPGLIGSLFVGVETAKALAYAKQKPLITVNHLAGHLYAALQPVKSFTFPYLGLLVSGGHTELVVMHGHHDFELIGSTRDDAAGEAFDKVGRLLGMAYPAGAELSTLASKGDSQTMAFPTAMLDQPNYDFSFSGMKTAARRLIEEAELTPQRRADIAATFQAAMVKVLVTKTRRAYEAYRPKAVLLGGGVAANRLLRHELATALKGTPLLAAPMELTTDNAAMIGIAAYWKSEASSVFGVTADPALPIA